MARSIDPTPPARPSLGVVIRFGNSAATLPAVLEALRRQTVQPDRLLGVDHHSTDGSADLMRAAGATVFPWTEPYRHPRVLNFAIRQCPTDLVLVLSSHTVLESVDTVERLVAAMADPLTACASGRWDDDAFYSSAIEWSELRRKGLKFGAIFSNSMGMLRRSRWEEIPFDETLPTMEDSTWAVEQVRRGYVCRRLDFPFGYRRSGASRDFVFAVLTFQLAFRHHLAVAWLGVRGTLTALLSLPLRRLRAPSVVPPGEAPRLIRRLAACLAWRWVQMKHE